MKSLRLVETQACGRSTERCQQNNATKEMGARATQQDQLEAIDVSERLFRALVVMEDDGESQSG